MSKVFSALAVSVDGYVTGRDPGAGRGLGDAAMPFDWYFDGDTPSRAGLVDEVTLHQVPVLLGGGRPYFQSLPEHVELRLVEAVPAPGVTHLHYEVVRPTDNSR
jgi:hypothetical protein